MQSCARLAGRPTGLERREALRVLPPVPTTWHTVAHIAAAAQVPRERVEITLWNLRREGLVLSKPVPTGARGRPPVVYQRAGAWRYTENTASRWAPLLQALSMTRQAETGVRAA